LLKISDDADDATKLVIVKDMYAYIEKGIESKRLRTKLQKDIKERTDAKAKGVTQYTFAATEPALEADQVVGKNWDNVTNSIIDEGLVRDKMNETLM